MTIKHQTAKINALKKLADSSQQDSELVSNYFNNSKPVTLKPGINSGLTNRQYHSEREHLSSSNLKLLLKNPQQFYQEKILGNKPDEPERPQFIEGSLVHSMILEPETVDQEYAFYPKFRKSGADYEAFCEQNQGKVIISAPQKHRCDMYVKAFQANPTAVNLLQGGVPELSMAAELEGVKCKIRCDYIVPDRGLIIDLKTTGHATDVFMFRTAIQDFSYELSAALYVRVAQQIYERPFNFYFVVISKADLGCAVYKVSPETLALGHTMVSKALRIYKQCKATGVWETPQALWLPEHSEEIIEV